MSYHEHFEFLENGSNQLSSTKLAMERYVISQDYTICLVFYKHISVYCTQNLSSEWDQNLRPEAPS